MTKMAFFKIEDTDFIFQNQLKNQESVKNCGTYSIFRNTYIFWILGVFNAILKHLILFKYVEIPTRWAIYIG